MLNCAKIRNISNKPLTCHKVTLQSNVIQPENLLFPKSVNTRYLYNGIYMYFILYINIIFDSEISLHFVYVLVI